MKRIYSVMFDNINKPIDYMTDDLTCPINVTVIVETERGLEFGKVISEKNESAQELSPIIRIATKQDYGNYLTNLKDEKEALSFARKSAESLKLDMNIINSHFTFDRKQLIFNFLADERIDFRELAKVIAAKYHTRIELRQIGARDKSKMIGGLGICGRKLCCASFLNHIDSISMNMAKNQNIALNPNKINGCCGRLLCCLTYEDEEYTKCRKGLPNINEEVIIGDQKGKVVSIDILNRKYNVNINNEIVEIGLDDNESSQE